MARILIVEDEPDIRALLKRSLELEGHRVSEATKGEDGLMMASSGAPDLIILDVMLPGMSGGEVIERLRKAIDTSRIPVILITASSQAEESLRWQVGTANTFGKPFIPEEVVDRVAAILGERG